MKIFISWSGSKSKAAAEALRDWLPSLIQAAEPWLSSEDIEKGTRWSSDLSAQLESSRVGIICLTVENVLSPWILFEAGALSKTLSESFVCPWLLDFTESSLKGPLIQFQATMADKEDTRRLVHTINAALADRAIDKERLDRLYDVLWPQLEEKLKSLPAVESESKMEEPDISETLAELIDLVRGLKRETSAQKEPKDAETLYKEEVAKLEMKHELIEL